MLKEYIKNLAEKMGYTIIKAKKTRDKIVRDEIRRLRSLPPGIPVTTSILGREIQIPCPRTFICLYEEIWEREIYSISCPDPKDPIRIIDAGANIGMATLYIKNRYPNAHITAIEADPTNCRMLRANLDSFGYEDVEIIQAALAPTEGKMSFHRDSGGTAGKISEQGEIIVNTIPLSHLINSAVNFLKIDIEGAEFGVLHEAKDKLQHVENLFVEYHSTVGCCQRLGQLSTLLEEAGFRHFLETTGAIPSKPLMSSGIHKGMDNLINIYAKRI